MVEEYERNLLKKPSTTTKKSKDDLIISEEEQDQKKNRKSKEDLSDSQGKKKRTKRKKSPQGKEFIEDMVEESQMKKVACNKSEEQGSYEHSDSANEIIAIKKDAES